MIGQIAWLWNIRHRKLVEEAEAIIRVHQFLRYDYSLQETDKLSVTELKMLKEVLD